MVGGKSKVNEWTDTGQGSELEWGEAPEQNKEMTNRKERHLRCECMHACIHAYDDQQCAFHQSFSAGCPLLQ